MKIEKILVVDDDPKMRKLLDHFLSSYGYDVDCTDDGLDALSIVDKGLYDLIIVDNKMPELTGVQFVKEVRGKKKALLLIALSADDVGDRFIEAGADFFMPKPFDLKSLKKEIDLLESL